ncbi:MAG: hypothetical protein AAF846_11255 [Chloroflexota bacterium]
MSVTLIMTWDIKDEVEQEYFEFMVREWGPKTSRMGLQPVAAWLTAWRIDETIPLIRAEAIAESESKIREILNSIEWHTIHSELLGYVDNYTHKIVETTGEFRM